MSFGLLLITGNQTHQENYARAFAADPRCRIVGLADEPGLPPRRQTLNRELAEELGVPLLEDLDAALWRVDVDLVSICAEPERRGRIARRAVEAGKHVYLDKEPAVTAEGARDLVAAVRQAGVRSQTFSLVRSPLAQRARDLLNSCELGGLTGMHCELFFAKGPAGTADLARPREESASAGRFTFLDSKRELLCVGWYPLVLFQWLTGERIARVSATTSNYFFAEHQRNGVEDFACLMLATESGIQGTITVGRTGWMSHPTHGVHQLELVGTRGSASIDAYRPMLTLHSDARPWQQPAVPHPEDPMGFWTSTQEAGGVLPKTAWFPVAPAFESDASHFLDCLEQDRESDVPAELAAHTLEVVLAGYRSAAELRWIDVA